MNIQQACRVVAAQRSTDSLLVATMGSMRAFDVLDADPACVCSAPPASRLSPVPLMGGAAGLGLGLALGKPGRSVIVVDGDASLLMELGSLVTMAQAAPTRLLHVVINNGSQFTGLANLAAPAPSFDFAAAARNAGYRYACTIADEATWSERFAALCAMDGPVFVELRIEAPLPQAQTGFEQSEMPDRQFERMGIESHAMQQMLCSEVH